MRLSQPLRILCAPLTLLLSLGLVACDKTKKPTVKPEGPKPVHRADPGPVLKRSTGAVAPKEGAQERVETLGVFTEGGYTYLYGLRTTSRSFYQEIERLRVEGGVAFLGHRSTSLPDLKRSGELIVARIKGGKPAGDVTLKSERHARWGYSRYDGLKSGTRHEVVLTGVSKAPVNAIAAERFWSTVGAFAGHYGSMSGAGGFKTFLSGRAKHLAIKRRAKTAQPTAIAPQRRTRNRVGDTMALYTGMTSVEEALQADRALLLRGTPEPRDIDLSTLKAAPLPNHPWPSMIQALKTKPVIEPLASRVPEDMLYYHAHDLRSFVKLARELDDLVTPAARAVEERGGDARFTKTIETQLAVQRSVLSEQLGHMAAKGFAITTSDPFLREGSDVSLVFHINNQSMLETTLAGYATAAKQARPDAKESTITIDGISVKVLATPDRAVNRHQLVVGDLLIVTNSRSAAARFIKVHKKQLKPLSARGDFQYMRALYPYDKKAEDGFLFIGDVFVNKTISPRTKILQSRRMFARADLQTVNNAALMFGMMEGRPAKTADEIVAAGYLTKAELKHTDGAPITFDPKRGAYSAKWGHITRMTPLEELPLDKITKSEQAAYTRFLRSYQSYWRGYIDPIAVRVTRSADGKRLELDGRMLPLIDGTDYNKITRLVGEQRFTPGRTAGVLEWTFGVGQKAGIRRELNSVSRRMTRRTNLTFDWLGSWITVGAADRSALLDLAIMAGTIPSTKGRSFRNRDLFQSTARSIYRRAPFYAIVDVQNVAALGTSLTALRSYINDAAPGILAWGALPKKYREVSIVRVEENIQQTGGQGDAIGVFYAITKGKFVLAMSREVLEARLDDVLDGRVATAATPDGALATATPDPTSKTAQSRIFFRPWPKSWAAETQLGMLERTQMRNAHQATMLADLIHATTGATTPAQLREAGLAFLGLSPSQIHGQDVTVTTGAHAAHPLYGNATAPSIPGTPVAGSPLTRIAQTLDELDMSLSFEGKGEHRGLHAKFVWQRR